MLLYNLTLFEMCIKDCAFFPSYPVIVLYLYFQASQLALIPYQCRNVPDTLCQACLSIPEMLISKFSIEEMFQLV